MIQLVEPQRTIPRRHRFDNDFEQSCDSAVHWARGVYRGVSKEFSVYQGAFEYPDPNQKKIFLAAVVLRGSAVFLLKNIFLWRTVHDFLRDSGYHYLWGVFSIKLVCIHIFFIKNSSFFSHIKIL